MKKLVTICRTLSVTALLSLMLQTSAQNLNEVKELYQKGAYNQVKPALKKLVKQQPGNATYSLWYGVCCLETGEPQTGLKHLQTAVKKRVPSGQFQLARCYDRLYRYEEAIDEMDTYISELRRRRRPAEEAEAELEKIRNHFRMFKGVEQVEIVDSLVVDKANLLSHYKLSDESGQIYRYSDFFKTETPADTTASVQDGMVYESELGNTIIYSERQADGSMQILTRTKQLESWSSPSPLPANINEGQNSHFPFLMSDGTTLYFAADGEGSLGGYDIFVTRYNTATDTYMTPENVGMPFNSPYNDYLFAIDEFNEIGWFASDRFQPEGKVCIYLFIPNSSKQVYNYETMDNEYLAQLAQLTSIQLTWEDKERVEATRQRLAQQLNGDAANQQTVSEVEFIFVINDEHIYHQLTDFRSPEAKQQFHSYRQMESNYKQQSYKLLSMRERYAAGTQEEKQRLKEAILDQEKRMDEINRQLKQMANQIRAIEQKAI